MFYSFLPKRYYFVRFNKEVVLAVEFISGGILQYGQDRYSNGEYGYCELNFAPETVTMTFGDGAIAKNIPRNWFTILD